MILSKPMFDAYLFLIHKYGCEADKLTFAGVEGKRLIVTFGDHHYSILVNGRTYKGSSWNNMQLDTHYKMYSNIGHY